MIFVSEDLKNDHNNDHKNDHNKLGAMLATPSLSAPMSPASPADTMIVLDYKETESKSQSVRETQSDEQTPVPIPVNPDNGGKAEVPPEIAISGVSTILAPKRATLSRENSAKSDNTMTTLSTVATTNKPRHHPSSSMNTHAPLNCWADSRYSKLTSSGGSKDRDSDLSSLAIKVCTLKTVKCY